MKTKEFIPLAKLVERISKELYSPADWKIAYYEKDRFGFSTDLDAMLKAVYDRAFETHPESFGDANWINDAYGSPIWVRPGVEWKSTLTPNAESI